MKIDAMENLTPAEKNGVNASSPNRIAIQVEPQIKHNAAYARMILNASLFKKYLSSQLFRVLGQTSFHHVCMNGGCCYIHSYIIMRPEY